MTTAFGVLRTRRVKIIGFSETHDAPLESWKAVGASVVMAPATS